MSIPLNNNVIAASTKEERERLLNLKIEQIKRQNEKLLNKHKLIEEDKRLAELQGRIISPSKHGDTGDNINVERKPNSSFCMDKNGENNYIRPRGQNMPPMEPVNFLFDKMRDGPDQKEDRKAQTRRHPRNYGGVNFEDVPKKIQQEKAKQNNNWIGPNKVDDMMMMMTGKERRELDEWRKERKEIDRKRLQRQKKEDGGWKREWDQNKDGLFRDNADSTRSNSTPRDSVFNNRGNSQGHYNRVYHQMRRSRGSSSEHHQDKLPLKQIDDNNNADSPRGNVNKSEDRNLPVPLTSSPRDDYSGNNRNFKNRNWKTGRGRPRNEFEKAKNFSSDSTPSSVAISPFKENSAEIGPDFCDSRQSSVSSSSSLRKSVRFVESPIIAESGNFINDQKPIQMDKKDPRTGRNFVGSGRFSGSQKLRGRGRWNRRELNARSPEYHSTKHSLKFGYPIKKIYLEEAMYKPVEIIINPPRSNKTSVDECVTDAEVSNKSSCAARSVSNESAASINVTNAFDSEHNDADKKSADDGEREYENDEGDDEDEQWEDIDEEVCLELDHGVFKEEANLDASSESFDEFIIKNTLRLELDEVNNEGLHLPTNQHESLLGQQGGYPDVLDWEDEVESISHLSDLEKFPIVDDLSEESKKTDEVDGLSREEDISSDIQDIMISPDTEGAHKNGIDKCVDLSTRVNAIDKGYECNDIDKGGECNDIDKGGECNDIDKGDESNDIDTDKMVYSKEVMNANTDKKEECSEVDATFKEITDPCDGQITFSSENKCQVDQKVFVSEELEIAAEIKVKDLSEVDSGDSSEKEKKEDIEKRLMPSDESSHYGSCEENQDVDVFKCP